MAETTFDNFYYRDTGTGNHYATLPFHSGNILPSIADDGLVLDGTSLQHTDSVLLVKILDETPVTEVTLQNSGTDLLTTTKRSGIVIQLLHINFQNRFNTKVIYWDGNITDLGGSTYDYNTQSKTHMIQDSFLDTDGHIAYRGTYSDATFAIRNFDNTEDVLVASDVKITQSIYDTYFDGSDEVGGTDMEAFFSVATPSGFGLDVSHEERRRMWVLGFNVRNV